MIRIGSIRIEGVSEAGNFAGELDFDPGLQVVSAHNAFGKSLVAKSFAWCLGLEPIFGVVDNDPSFFPIAVREEIELEGQPKARVTASRCITTLLHSDGRALRLARDIRGNPSVVDVDEVAPDGSLVESKLHARLKAMSDVHGGLQRFLFDWLGWPRVAVSTFTGTTTDLYLENLAPLFYIEQDEGWTDIQARQIGKYQQQQVGQVAVEYLLGAVAAIESRLAQQSAVQRATALRASARIIAEQVALLFARHGWAVDWSGQGTLSDTVSRWSSQTLRDAVAKDASVDLAAEIQHLAASADKLRQQLTKVPIDAFDVSSHSSASQKVIEIKARRHEMNEELHGLRVQHEEAEGLLESIERRLHAAEDVLRLKETGVGRLDHVECPTCHRDLDPATFALTDQANSAVRAHIDALKRDRDLLRKNAYTVGMRLTSVRAEQARLDAEFRDAERALVTITQAVGPVREQLGAIASKLSTTERLIERLKETGAEIDALQQSVDAWLIEAREVRKDVPTDPDLSRRIGIFTDALRAYLIALGHSAVSVVNAPDIHLDEQYVPFLGNRRLKSLGSASDRSRLVAAYSLALAAAAEKVAGFHPGVVLLDEPLQQNPDDEHREFFSTFLSTRLTVDASFQTIVLTFMRVPEIATLRESGTPVSLPTGKKLLRLPSTFAESESDDGAKSDDARDEGTPTDSEVPRLATKAEDE
ncbi:MAG TPA: hypothetical protein VHX14_25440 [Thermoanaerobaculia bacterium]|nr:hypothetical protein [Thermoanaerobaculia bacterium]